MAVAVAVAVAAAAAVTGGDDSGGPEDVRRPPPRHAAFGKLHTCPDHFHWAPYRLVSQTVPIGQPDGVLGRPARRLKCAAEPEATADDHQMSDMTAQTGWVGREGKVASLLGCGLE